MAEATKELEGSDFEKGCEINEVADGEMFLGHTTSVTAATTIARMSRAT